MSSKKVTPRSLIHGVLDTNSVSKSTTKTSRTVRRRSVRKSISNATPGTLIKGVLQTTSTAKKSPARERRVDPTPLPPSSSRRAARAARRASLGGQNPTPRGLIQGYLAATAPETPAVRVVHGGDETLGENVTKDTFQGQFLHFISPDVDTPEEVASQEGRERRGAKRQRQTATLSAAFQAGVNRRVQEGEPSMSDSAVVASPTLNSIPEEGVVSEQAQQDNSDDSHEDEYEDAYQGPTQPQRSARHETADMPSQFEVPDTSVMSMNALREVAVADTFQIPPDRDLDSNYPESQSFAGNNPGSQSEEGQTGQSEADDDEPSAKRSKLTDDMGPGEMGIDGNQGRRTSRSFLANETGGQRVNEVDDFISEDEGQPSLRRSPRRSAGQKRASIRNDNDSMIIEDEELAGNEENQVDSIRERRSSRSRGATPRSLREQNPRYGGVDRSRGSPRYSRVQDAENESDSLLSEDGQENHEQTVRGNRSRRSRVVTPRSVVKQNSQTGGGESSFARSRGSPSGFTVQESPDRKDVENRESEDSDHQIGSDVTQGRSAGRGQSSIGTPHSSRKHDSRFERGSKASSRSPRRSRVRESFQNKGDSPSSEDRVQMAESEVDREELVTEARSRRSKAGSFRSSREQISTVGTATENEVDSLESQDEQPSPIVNEADAIKLGRSDLTRGNRVFTPGSPSKRTSRSRQHLESLEDDAGRTKQSEEDYSRGTTETRGEVSDNVTDGHAGDRATSDEVAAVSDVGDVGGEREATPGLAEYLEESTASSSGEGMGEEEIDDDGYSPLVTPNVLPGRPKTPAARTPAVLKERNKSTANPAVNQQRVTQPSKKEPRRDRVLPLSLTKSIFSHFCTGRVSRDAWDAIEDCADEFFDRLCKDLARYSKHAKRQTIQVEDAILLMRRQGLVTNEQSFYALIEKYLALEYRRELIPCAQAGGGVMPEQMTELF